MEVRRGGSHPSEHVLARIRPAAAAYWGVVDLSGTTAWLAMTERAPWRSALVLLAVLISWRVTGSDLMLGVGLLAGLVLGALELWHRRDWLTITGLTRQYGFLGRS